MVGRGGNHRGDQRDVSMLEKARSLPNRFQKNEARSDK
jgi:hypothetical protein